MTHEKQFLWDDRAPSFRLLAEGAALIARRNGIKLDELTYRRVSDMGGMIREVDTLHDDFHVSADEILERLTDYSEFKTVYPSLGPDELEPEKRGFILGTSRYIFSLGAYARLMSNPWDYAELRHEEASTTALLATNIATDAVLTHPAYRSSYVPEMQQLAVGVTFFDSLLDGFIDYRRGKTSVKPDWEYYKAIRSVGRVGMRSVMKLMVSGPSLPLFTLDMAQQRIRTRIQNGMTEYSTMQNVPDFFRHIARRKTSPG